MPDVLKRFIIACFLCCASILYADAQPKAVGASFSLSGIGITYEHVLKQDCFIKAEIRSELGEHFLNDERLPGASLSLVSNFILKDWKSRNGNTVHAFAGPGITAGISHDFRKDFGYFYGLKGIVGRECLFERKVSISLSLSPTIGMHMILRDEYLEMKYYRNGLISTVIPEIGVRYIF